MTNSGRLLLLANWIRLNNQSCNAFLEHTEAASSVSYHISVKEKNKTKHHPHVNPVCDM